MLSQASNKNRHSSELLRGLSATTRLGRVIVPTRSTGIQAGSERTLLRTEKLVDQGVLPALRESSRELQFMEETRRSKRVHPSLYTL